MFIQPSDNPFERPRTGRILLWLVVLVVVGFGSFVAGIAFGRLLSVSQPDSELAVDLTNQFQPTPKDDLTNTGDVMLEPETPVEPAVTPTSTEPETPTTTDRDIFKPVRTGTWLKITATETGFLNVRSEPSASGTLIKKVYPTDEFQYTEEKNGWFKIILDEKTSGWVSGKYTEKITL